ncbi:MULTISPECIES: DUF2795 domain-containing protein [unclassified Streptomyces]|uniref:DUF2795 domain-containing protein n=1 Tax=unclassified Streptomyces TaxID=2593676 RepID=UPI000380D85D|nr:MULTISPECIES: DUF2795 domain-containing protein [unclassified Streptomyces]MYS42203.1 DUF2795 domain-containing protein [Streptomyces sp. SID5998]MYX47440.1 DUF2795 domain-containing protein [Streptomyces sp. SID89]NED77684.1 DUF2795 domain-containing protein [Streptomyces sp. SID9944]MYX29487.1 DUF2795 domain-containing protein [Streptomyces sp. SID8381]NED36502.1 DUF2795 domain-containing protein [Streptomyces sp. SID8499]
MADLSPIDLQKALSGADYPTDKQHLVERARKNKANDKIVSRLDGLKQDHFDGPNEVQKAVFNE